MPRRSPRHNTSTIGLRLAYALTLLCQPAIGASAWETCGGDYVCMADGSHGVKSERAAPVTPEPCGAAAVHVAAASWDERQLTCSAAHDAIKLLDRCGIFPSRPIQVQIANEVRRPLGGAIFGLFDSKQEKVLVTREANVPALVSGTPYAGLPQREFYKSLIVHEVVHAVIHHNLVRQPTTYAAYEYPAYALQIESLPSAVRDDFLRSLPIRTTRDDFVFTDNILFFDPFFFAARAYEHFKASPDGCVYLNSLLLGEAAFISTLTP